ncbi:hypothetical protein DAMA08_039900 [Martiniozyma asiatica (nom. inval.)]|nr:hypothetical protein DAMA08_039900 [Martiniozyma asiatica]
MDDLLVLLPAFADIDKHLVILPQFKSHQTLLNCLLKLTTPVSLFPTPTIDDHGKQPDDSLSHISASPALVGSSLEMSHFKSHSIPAGIQYHIIVENQRGTTLSGTHHYSPYSLIFPADPPPYELLNGIGIFNFSLYPNLSSQWVWDSDWSVFMLGDVDEEGWVYSGLKFGKRWSGKGGVGRFVRRRVWVRHAKKIQRDEDQLENSLDDVLWLSNSDKQKQSLNIKNIENRMGYSSENQSEVEYDLIQKRNVDLEKEAYSFNTLKEHTLQTYSINLDEFYAELITLKIDRLKIDFLLKWVYSLDVKTLSILHNEGFWKPWLEKIFSVFKFKESKKIFFKMLRKRATESQFYLESKSDILAICDKFQ